MENRFKFRFWDSEEKRMITEYGSRLFLYFQGYTNTTDADLKIPRHIFPMQYSSVFDSKGIRICEGDILEGIYQDINPYGIYRLGKYQMEDGSEPITETKRRYKVIYREDENGLGIEYIDWFRKNSGEDNGKPVTGFLYVNRMEYTAFTRDTIIGNIFENPELLNHGKQN